jgi:small subunit ribosomal protein S1
MSSDSSATPPDEKNVATNEPEVAPTGHDEARPEQGPNGSPPAVAESPPLEPAELTAEDVAEPAETTPASTEETAGDEPQRNRPKIQVGSRRGDAANAPTSRLPQMTIPSGPLPAAEPQDSDITPAENAAAEPATADASATAETVAETTTTSDPPSTEPAAPERPATPVPTPSQYDKLTPDMEKELNEALADVSLEQIASDSATDRASEQLETDSRHHATIVRVHGDNAFFSLGGKNEGVVSVRQFKEPPSVGQELEVVVKGFNAEDGLYELLVPGAAVEVSGWSDLAEGTVVEARITGANTGGLECMVGNVRGFIPASQIAVFRVEDFAEYIGQKLPCVATEVNRKRKNLVLSHRAILEREKEEARKQLLEELEPKQVREGVVRSLQSFGAFVDLGGVDGLIHISQLSWERVNHPSEVLKEGQKVRVKIEKVNRQTGKIALSYRDLLEHPWANVEQQFQVAATVQGTVSRVAKFGAFVKLAAGVEGLVHISELAHQHVRSVGDVLKEGQSIEVKVLSIDTEAQRIALSLKATLPEPPPEEKPPEESEEKHPHRAPIVPKRKKPLKGGVDGPSGGEKFGLNW